MENNEILNLVLAAMPYADQIRDVDMTSEENAIRFTWRHDRFRVDGGLDVGTVQNSCIHGCNLSIIMRTMLKQANQIS